MLLYCIFCIENIFIVHPIVVIIYFEQQWCAHITGIINASFFVTPCDRCCRAFSILNKRQCLLQYLSTYFSACVYVCACLLVMHSMDTSLANSNTSSEKMKEKTWERNMEKRESFLTIITEQKKIQFICTKKTHTR